MGGGGGGGGGSFPPPPPNFSVIMNDHIKYTQFTSLSNYH